METRGLFSLTPGRRGRAERNEEAEGRRGRSEEKHGGEAVGGTGRDRRECEGKWRPRGARARERLLVCKQRGGTRASARETEPSVNGIASFRADNAKGMNKFETLGYVADVQSPSISAPILPLSDDRTSWTREEAGIRFGSAFAQPQRGDREAD